VVGVLRLCGLLAKPPRQSVDEFRDQLLPILTLPRHSRGHGQIRGILHGLQLFAVELSNAVEEFMDAMAWHEIVAPCL
jgi:hypothetical protein